MKISNLQELFVEELADLYSAEQQIIVALPAMIRAASDDNLKTALEEHLEVTREQLVRLDAINQEVPFKSKVKLCDGMAGIIKEGEKMLSSIEDPATLDAAIIGSAQRVEHYEMAGYGTTIEFAHKLDLHDIADVLQETLDEEKDADASLSGLAKGGLFTTGLNEKAIEE